MLDKPFKEIRIGDPCVIPDASNCYEVWIDFDCGTTEWEMVEGEILERINQWQQASQLSGSEAKKFMGDLSFQWPENHRGYDSKVHDIQVYYYNSSGIKHTVELL